MAAKKILIGTSWKMNKTVPESIEYAKELLSYVEKKKEELRDVTVFILPTFLAIAKVSEVLRGTDILYGAQDCCWADEGAFTGEVSPMHLKDLGSRFAELGHAERREMFAEDDEMINKKVLAALKNGLSPILCIGEEERFKDDIKAYDYVVDQLEADIKGIENQDMEKIVIAYEPVWAIGSDASAPLDFIQGGMKYIRDYIKERFGEETAQKQLMIYGGSVTPDTAEDIMNLKDNDGIFIGRAALKLDYFFDMIEMAIRVSKNS
jgi:triosephosphate isomerase